MSFVFCAAVILAGALLLVGFGLAAWLGVASRALPARLRGAPGRVLAAGSSTSCSSTRSCIAAGFPLARLIAGALAVPAEISHWLLLCTMFLALFLALSKRKAEMDLLAGGGTTAASTARSCASTTRRSWPDRRPCWPRARSSPTRCTPWPTRRSPSSASGETSSCSPCRSSCSGSAATSTSSAKGDRGEEPENVLLGDLADSDHRRGLGGPLRCDPRCGLRRTPG